MAKGKKHVTSRKAPKIKTTSRSVNGHKPTMIPATSTAGMLDVPVNFGSFSSGGKRGCSIGFNIPKEGAPGIGDMEHFLCNARLQVTLLNGGTGDPKGQQSSEKLGASKFTGVADINSFSTKKADYGGTLSFKLSADEEDDEIIGSLAHLAGKGGRIRAEVIGTAGGDDAIEDATAEDPDQMEMAGVGAEVG